MGLLVLEYCPHNTIISANLQGLAWLAASTFRQVKIIFKFMVHIVKKKFPLVYRRGAYIEMVGKCVKESMVKAAEEVKGLPHYASEGEVEY